MCSSVYMGRGRVREKNHFLNFFHVFDIFCYLQKKKKRKKLTIASHFLDEGGEKNENQKKLSIGGIWGWKCAHTWMQKNQIFVKKRKLKWIFECFRLILKVFLWVLSWTFNAMHISHVYWLPFSYFLFSLSTFNQSKWKIVHTNKQSAVKKREKSVSLVT